MSTSVMSPFDRLRELEKKRFHEERKGQVPVMDAETLRELCLDNDGYETPELNDSLYAHFRGFQRIEGLEAYFNLKALWLESNGLSRIENLDHLVNLRCLYLSKNLIEKVENVCTLRELNTLDLSENRIQTLAGLAQLPNLLSLNASRNQLTTSADLEELAQCPLLNNIDISHNSIDDDDPEVLTVLKKIPMLKALRITGNPVVSTTRSFRKTYIAALPQLSFLDRPIFPIERASVTAWYSGGVEAERKAKQTFVNQENEERRRSLQEFRDWQAQVRERRIKELELERAQKLLEATPEAEPEEIDVDLRGFRAITKEEYVAMDASERAKWDARIEEAHADSQQEKYEVLGDGITRMGSKFWASTENASNTNLQQHEDTQHESTAARDLQDSSNGAEIAKQDAEKPAAAEVEVAGNLQHISLVDTTKSLAGQTTTTIKTTSNCKDEQATTRGEEVAEQVANEHDDRRKVTCASALSAAATLKQPDLPPPAPLWPASRVAVEPRETWNQLQQRAGAAPFRLRPQTLPSAFAPEGEDEDDERTEEPADDGPIDQLAAVRVLSRADILHELTVARQQRTMHEEDLPPPNSLYTNVSELD
ncbi:hypothetical protein PHMEG_0008960 [Phytophthora megakarya]|uniref:Dynein assembly factor 1, axonemal homolog n=1 Tax=Phytophthora megakarya TaxID=4795 RepID=A0A225WI73_9STRA|nr:hypothetical protein PHMEG_0008960 [Phytophthora megakarya]